MQWFRMYAEFATDPVVQSLSFDDQRHFVVVLCLKASGLLDREYTHPQIRVEIIRKALGLDTTTMHDTKTRLSAVGIIDHDWQPTSWDKRQYLSDTSAERTRKYRKRLKSDNGNRHGDVTVTPPDTDTDTDTENKSSASVDALLTSKNHKLTGEQLGHFETFWDIFAYKKGKAEAAEVWFKLKPDFNKTCIIWQAARLEVEDRKVLMKNGGTPKWAQGWLSARRYEDYGIVINPLDHAGFSNQSLEQTLRGAS